MELSNVNQCLAYLYTVFASLADGNLEESELKEIALLLKGWTAGEEKDIKQIHKDIEMAREMLSVDIKETNKVNDQLKFCIDSIKDVWNNDKETNLAVVQDLINIGLSDGDFDKDEKKWVNTLTEQFGIKMPSIESAKLAKKIANAPVDSDPNNNLGSNNFEEDKDSNNYDEDGWAYNLLPKHWKNEHIISCLVRWIMTLKLPVAESEMNRMNNIIRDYDLEEVNVSGVWNDVDDEILNLCKTGTLYSMRYPLLINDSLIYVDQNFKFEEKQVLLNHLTQMIAQTDIVEHEEYLALKTCVDYWFPGQLDEPLSNLKDGGIKVISKPMEEYDEMHFRLIGIKKIYENFKFDAASKELKRGEIKKEENHINKITEKSSDLWTEEEINQIIKHKNYGKGSKNGDDLILKIVSNSNISDIWLEEFALIGLHTVEVVKHIAKNLKTDEWLLNELYQRETTKEWSEVDRLVLEHPNCPENLKDDISSGEEEVKWGYLDLLAYLYQAYASTADGTLHKKEKKEIRLLLKDWDETHENPDITRVDKALKKAKKTLFKDFNSGESKLNERILFCLNCIKDMSAWGDSEYRAILVDMVNIGISDGDYSDSERKWVANVGKHLNVDGLPSISQAQESRPDDINYVHNEKNEKNEVFFTTSTSKEEALNDDWNIIHDLGVFYMYFANLSDHPDGDLKKDELDYILKVYPKWAFNFDNVKYGFGNKNPSNLQETWDFIFSKMYDNGDPMPIVNQSHKNLIDYINKGLFTVRNLDTFLQTLYDLCMADNVMTEGQKHQLTYYCEFFKSGSVYANTALAMMNPEGLKEQLDDIFDAIEFDTEGRPIEKNNDSDDKDIQKEKPSSRKKKIKSKQKKKLTVQGQLADEILKLHPNAFVKKVDDGNYLDIHMPDIHSKKGTHIWFNTPKAGGIKIGFFCRDKEFIEQILKINAESIEAYGNGLRLLGHPTFKNVDDAIKVSNNFLKLLKA